MGTGSHLTLSWKAKTTIGTGYKTSDVAMTTF